MECNIGKKGRALRLTAGLVLIAVGLALVIAIFTGNVVGWYWWSIALAVFASGLFTAYEAAVGWCVVRAMGVKTPI